MRAVLLGLVTAIILLGSVMADPSNLEGGVFIAHHPAAVEFSSDPPPGGWCQHYLDDYAITSCEEQVNRLDTSGGSVWFVLAAWDEPKEWCGAEFGLGQYVPESFHIVDHGPCFRTEGIQIPTQGWPGPNEGVSFVKTDSSWTGNYIPIYYFVGYAYGQDVLPLSTNPITGFAGTADCLMPPRQWPAASLSAMGLFENGVYACPSSAPGPGGETAACCVQSDCYQLTAEQCIAFEGEFHPSELLCYMNVCDAYLRCACCLGDSTCAILTTSQCTEVGGTWMADLQSCEPTPCEQGETSWGVIRIVTE